MNNDILVLLNSSVKQHDLHELNNVLLFQIDTALDFGALVFLCFSGSQLQFLDTGAEMPETLLSHCHAFFSINFLTC